MRAAIAAGALGLLLWHGSGAADDGVIHVGSKSFTESYILAEIVAQVIERTGEARVERQLGLGGTGITQRAIVSGAIDIYPEYTGTLSRVILKDPALVTPDAIRALQQHLRARGPRRYGGAPGAGQDQRSLAPRSPHGRVHLRLSRARGRVARSQAPLWARA